MQNTRRTPTKRVPTFAVKKISRNAKSMTDLASLAEHEDEEVDQIERGVARRGCVALDACARRAQKYARVHGVEQQRDEEHPVERYEQRVEEHLIRVKRASHRRHHRRRRLVGRRGQDQRRRAASAECRAGGRRFEPAHDDGGAHRHRHRRRRLVGRRGQAQRRCAAAVEAACVVFLRE